jgi:thiol-disulfide isomerase/thioredoxin
MKRRDFSLAFCAATLPVLGLAQSPAPGAAIEWPTIALLDGSSLTSASWRDQPAVVVVWETFCPFCKRHNAHLDKLFRATQPPAPLPTGAPRLRILAIALDTDEQVVRRYMKSNDYRFPVAMDGGQLRRLLTTRRVIPMTFVLNRQGRLVQSIAGEMFEEDVLEFSRLTLSL